MSSVTANYSPRKFPTRGFASMSAERVGEIARRGGEASAARAGHEVMAERGRKGGISAAASAGPVGMAERGRKGGEASSRRGKKNHNNDDKN
jgi:general stress protein YciG